MLSAPRGERVLCVTLNAALDVTYAAPAVSLGEANRVDRGHSHAGGKGVNVARLLAAWGRDVTVLGFAGGLVGAEIVVSLEAAGLPHVMVPCAEPSRRTVTVVSAEDGTSTGFYQPGPRISPDEWQAFLADYEAQLPFSGLVVLSGSLPPGVPGDAYGQLTAAARSRGLPVVLDVHGRPLMHALAAGPSVVTPNESELAEALSVDRPIPLDVAADSARRLVAGGADRAVATLGPRGLIAVQGDRTWRVTAPTVRGNPVGAGDAVVAVLADGALAGEAWPETLCRAAATAAAAVRNHVAGAVEPADVAELEGHVEVLEL